MKADMDKNSNNQISKKRKIIFSIISIIIAFIFIFMIGELLLRIFFPQEYMYPRWKFSPKYGAVLFDNCKMIHACPGRWKFIYKINEYHYRGKLIPISNVYDKKNIIILGDSYSFGHGVNDRDEYSAVIANKLKYNYNIINLSTGGWGLTQQIRRYYEFGQLYFPKIVLLQFCDNDLDDNFVNMVTTIEKGKFKFQNSKNTSNWIKKYLSRSIIQKSQIYNLFRDAAYQFFARRIAKKEKLNYQKKNSYDKKISPKEQFYNELLELFTKDLDQKGVELIMISVNRQLEQFPNIKAKVSDLSSKGLINYYDVIPWFENVSNYGSPEGHLWGKKAHYILGEKLSEIIKKKY